MLCEVARTALCSPGGALCALGKMIKHRPSGMRVAIFKDSKTTSYKIHLVKTSKPTVPCKKRKFQSMKNKKRGGRENAGVHVLTRCRGQTIAAFRGRSSQYFRPLRTIERETLKPETAFFLGGHGTVLNFICKILINSFDLLKLNCAWF